MKYTPEITAEILKDWNLGEGLSILELSQKYEAPKRSLITKLGNLGVYKAKEYRNKQGDVPVKKSEYIERIAVLLDVTPDRLDSLEKSNKWILALLVGKLSLSQDERNHQALVSEQEMIYAEETSGKNEDLQNIIEQPLTPSELAALRLRVPEPMGTGTEDPLLMRTAKAQDILDCGGISDAQPTGKISGVSVEDLFSSSCSAIPLGAQITIKEHNSNTALWPVAAT